MALPILDGNQSATTLSTILSSGQHIPAHTVVSLGTQAITDMRSAVSGSVVSISNFPATQPVSIASVTIGNTVTIAGTVTIGSALPSGTNRIGVVTIGAGTVTIGAGTAQIGSVTASISNSLTIGSLPAISGTVTVGALPTIGVYVVEAVQDGNGNTFGNDRDFPISGTVTANLDVDQIDQLNFSAFARINDENGSPVNNGNPLPISGTVTANVFVQSAFGLGEDIAAGMTEAGGIPISGTVTANSSNGSLTTRFGSVTTANTAFATSAVTNANRKYLLIQNVTTASNVITVGIGFTPTTTQGIQLSSGAGLTFEGSYIPTGAVNLLSSVTASCFTILEA